MDKTNAHGRVAFWSQPLLSKDYLRAAKRPAPPLYMPAWRQMLTDEEIGRIVEYLWSLQPKKGTAW